MKALLSAGQVLIEDRMYPGTGATNLHYILWHYPTRKVTVPKRR